MVFRRARALLGNDADAQEAAQEVFIRWLQGIDGFQERALLSTWLYRITTNYCLNRIRDARRRRELWDDHAAREAAPHGRLAPDQMLLLRRLLAEADASERRPPCTCTWTA